MRTTAVLFLALLGGCDLLEEGADTGTTPTAGTLPTTDWQPSSGAWSGAPHPCVGNRTDAMHWDDKETVWVGCGTTTIGTGLYRSTDGGESWSEVAPAELGAFRVSSLQRAADGRLYVGGIDTSDGDRVVSLDADDQVSLVFEAGDQVWNSFHVGTYRQDASGFGVAESLTGTGLVVRTDSGAAFLDGSDWPTDGGSYQILDLELHANAFYGVGSTIATPPHVFLPASGSPFAMDPVALADWNGEMWSLDVDGGGVVIGGVDQQMNVGVVFFSGPGPASAEDFTEVRLDALAPGTSPTWIRGVCRSGQLMAAVGEYSTRADPVLWVSADGGTSWVEWTDDLPGSPGALHQCTLWPGGRLAVTGQDGYLAVWDPAG